MSAADQLVRRVLIVEDSDVKFRSVLQVLEGAFGPHLEAVRASSITEAEAFIADEAWSLILLDISMDIAARGAGGAGHANLGGLSIALKMFLTRRESPTIIVTAFDSFESTSKKNTGSEMVDLSVIDRKAREYLGNKFIGHVRYGDVGWSKLLLDYLKMADQV